jgi:anti-sigma B factor antagonist
MTKPGQFATGRRADGTPVLAATGEIDMSNAEAFADALAAALADSPDGGVLVIDLTGIGYLDSAGLSTLFRYADRIELVAPRSLGSLLTIAGLTQVTTVHIAEPGA